MEALTYGLTAVNIVLLLVASCTLMKNSKNKKNKSKSQSFNLPNIMKTSKKSSKKASKFESLMEKDSNIFSSANFDKQASVVGKKPKKEPNIRRRAVTPLKKAIPKIMLQYTTFGESTATGKFDQCSIWNKEKN